MFPGIANFPAGDWLSVIPAAFLTAVIERLGEEAGVRNQLSESRSENPLRERRLPHPIAGGTQLSTFGGEVLKYTKDGF